MKIEQLDSYLFSYTDSEKRNMHYDTPILSKRYERIEKVEFQGRTVYNFQFNTLLKNNLICLNKETRFSYIPEHIHTVIEFLYVYSGKCTQIIDGKKVKMKQGDICLLDTDVPHSIEYINKDDIIITIEMRKEYLTHGFLQRLGNSGIITSFLVGTLSSKSLHNQYLLFNHRNDNQIHNVIQNILCEYLDPTICSNQIIDANVVILYCELLRQYRNNYVHSSQKDEGIIVHILEYIENNSLNVTLESAAEHFGFHPNYLSSLIKKSTGYTFKSLVIYQRMCQACLYLTTTDLSIEEIAKKLGYENQGFFYRKFEQIYHLTPNEYRVTHTSSDVEMFQS